MGKVLIIGLDGVSPGVFEIIAREDLPNLQRIVTNGVQGVLRSVYSPVSPCAWLSITTGKNPGKTGIFGFISKRGYEEIPVNTNNVEDDCIWDILSDHGKKVIVGNIPFTYPPYAVSGIMISGMMAPEGVDNRTYPKELYKELLEEVGYAGGRMDPRLRESRETYISGILGLNRSEIALFDYIRKKWDWDFLMFNFQSIDGVQHELGPLNETLTEMLMAIDGALGRVLDEDDDVSMFIISDHGQGKRELRFSVNQWLISEDYLSINTAVLRKVRVDRRKIKALARNLLPKRAFTYLLTKFGGQARRLVPRKSLTLNEINWAKTRAFALDSGNIFINLKGREPKGIVAPGEEYESLRKEIMEKLLKVEANGRRCFRRDSVFRGEEVWWGSSSNDRPDIVFWDARVNPTNWIDDGILFKEMPGGGHSIEGIIMAYGPDIRHEKVNASVMEVMPTVLHLIGVLIPEDVDGKVLDIFKEGSEPRRRKSEFAKPQKRKEREESLTEKDEELIKDRLRGLGYIG
jgi:predicted AlkP superfamily phosphohydrolase/phosphomutase